MKFKESGFAAPRMKIGGSAPKPKYRLRAKAPEPPLSDAQLAAWRDWFDVGKTSIRKALGVFQIDTELDEGDDEKGDDGGVRHEPFDLRKKQAHVLDVCENWFWKIRRRAARIICLKCRRYGMSTFFILFGLERILRVPGYRVLLVAQDDVMAKTHFQRLRGFLKQIPAQALEEAGIVIVRDTEQQVILRHGRWKESEFRVAPAKRNALGRGDRFNMLILTEYPQWPSTAKADLSGILRACKNHRGNVTIFESTARGHDEFYRRWMRAERRESDYRAVFIGSYEHPGNRSPLDAEAEAELLRRVGLEPEFGGDEETMLLRRLMVDLKWPQSDALSYLNWRRKTIVDECEGLLDVYHREEPCSPSEAFLGTGFPIFRKDLLVGWLDLAEAREAAAKTGRVGVDQNDKPKFQPFRNGELTVFEPPEEGARYCYGADVASGIKMQSEGKKEADFSVVVVGSVKTGATVARFRGHIRPREFAGVVFDVSSWYGGARGYIERNGDGATVIDRLEEIERGDKSGAEIMLRQRRLVKSDPNNKAYRDEYGFRTLGGSRGTKVSLMDRIADYLVEMGVPDSSRECPFDMIFVEEALRFERDDRGRMNASTGHDDCVVAEALMLESRVKELKEMPEEEKRTEEESKDGWAILLRHAQGVRDNERRDIETAPENAVAGMPDY